MNPGFLLLHPHEAEHCPDPQRLAHRLQQSGLCGTPLDQTNTLYAPGRAFLNMVTYLGCSPRIPLDESEQGERCSIRLLGPYAEARLISDHPVHPPRCKHCNEQVTDWLTGRRNTEVRCPGCEQVLLWEHLDWNRRAGAGRLFIAISHVFPGEAIPQQALLEELQQASHEWEFFYTCTLPNNP